MTLAGISYLLLNKINNMAILNLKKDNFLKVLIKNLGNVSKTCDATGVDRSTYYHWTTHDPDFKKKLDEIQEIIFEFVESSLYDKIAKGDTRAIDLYFRYSPTAKKKGWKRNLDVTTNGESLNIPQITINVLPPAESDGIIDITPIQQKLQEGNGDQRDDSLPEEFGGTFIG